MPDNGPDVSPDATPDVTVAFDEEENLVLEMWRRGPYGPDPGEAG